MTGRGERIRYAENLLEAGIKNSKTGRVFLAEFIKELQKPTRLGVKRETAWDYWNIIRRNPKFQDNGQEVWLK